LALYDIPAGEPFQLIHAYVPKAYLDEVVEEGGVIFFREGNVCGGLQLVDGYAWTTEGEWKDREVISRGGRHGVVCEVAKVSEVGSFADFRKEFLSNPVEYDRENLTLSYHSKRNGVLRMDTRGQRELDGEAVYLDYPTYGNPFMQSEWDSGVVSISKGGRTLVLDFPEALAHSGDEMQR